MDKFIAHILVVDDDDGIRSLVKKYLNENKFLVTTAENAENASEKIKIIKFDLIVLDIMMPGKSGLEFLKENKKKLDTPVILLTAKGEANERVEGLETGADDYITKPFSQRLLLARIRTVLRRAAGGVMKTSGPNIICQGELLIDPDRHLCSWKGKEVKLTVTEFLILQALALRPGMVKNRDQLMDAAYGESIFLDDRTIDSHIKRLRRKLRVSDPSFDQIETLYGIGYKYKTE